MTKFSDYVENNRIITIIYPPNISRNNMSAALISENTFLNQEILILTDDKEQIKKYIKTDLPDNIFISYINSIPNRKKGTTNNRYIIIDSISLWLSNKKKLSRSKNTYHIFLTTLELSLDEYNKYQKLYSNMKYIKLTLSNTFPHIKYKIENTESLKLQSIIKYIILYPYSRHIIYTKDVDNVSSNIKKYLSSFRKRYIVIYNKESEKSIIDKYASWSSSNIKSNNPYIIITDTIPTSYLYNVLFLHIYDKIDYIQYDEFIKKIYNKKLYNIGYDDLNIVFHIYNDITKENYKKLSTILTEKITVYQKIQENAKQLVNLADNGFTII